MTKGLRCPSCDTTINKKVVLDYLLNQKAAHLRCSNTFCNVRWKRSVLEANKATFMNEPKPKVVRQKVKVEKPKTAKPKKVSRSPSRPIKRSTTWLDRIRTVAQHHAQIHGVVAIDALRLWADIHNDHPQHSSAWGSVFQGDHWKKVSQKRSTYARSRSRQVNVWSLRAPTPVAV